MKKLILLTLICSSFTGCGHSSTGTCTTSPLVANWKSTYNVSLDINSNTTFMLITSDGCASSGIYICPGAVTSGIMNITVTTAALGTCLPTGNYNCAFTYNSPQLVLQCSDNSGNVYPSYTFEKQ